MMKGQTELIVILGVVFLAVVVAVYSLAGSGIVSQPLPEGVYAQQKQVAQSVQNSLRDATDETLAEIMAHGGYLEEPVPGISGTYSSVPYTNFLLTGVPFWQRCDSAMYPSIEEITISMERSIEHMVKQGLDDIEEQYGNRVSFQASRARASVDIKGDDPFEPEQIDVALTLPTTVRNHTLPADLYPYEVSVRTNFGRIYSFGRDFAEASAENRYFDVFTISAIYFSKRMEGEDIHVQLPTSGVLTQCGEVIYRNPNQINGFLLGILEYVMTSTEWWQPMQPASGGPKTFAIQDLNGESYGDLDIRTAVADDWYFSVMDFIFETNFRMLSHGGYTIPICTASFNHAYDFSYPFIIRVRDPYTGHSFNMASEVAVTDRGDEMMEPGACSSWVGPGPTPGHGNGGMPAECADASCRGSVKVTGSDGEPLEGAFVVYGSCPLGETGPNGILESDIRCGSHELVVYHGEGLEFFRQEVPAPSMESGFSVTLNRVDPVTFHFRDVTITRQGYRTNAQGEKELVSCYACAEECSITEETMHQCSTGLIDREYAVLELDNGNLNMPVSNMDTENVPQGCRDTPECEFCSENSGEAESANESMSSQILTACKACAQGCYAPPRESAVMPYLPSGYSYSVKSRMYNPDNNYMVNGGLDYSGFFLEEGVTELYSYTPVRAPGRMDYGNQELTAGESSCLLSAMGKCELDPVTEEKHISTTVVLSEAGCTCSNLRGIVESCGGSSSMFCQCPVGGSCGQACGGSLNPPCTTCCDRDEVLGYLESVEASCGIRVICSG